MTSTHLDHLPKHRDIHSERRHEKRKWQFEFLRFSPCESACGRCRQCRRHRFYDYIQSRIKKG